MYESVDEEKEDEFPILKKTMQRHAHVHKGRFWNPELFISSKTEKCTKAKNNMMIDTLLETASMGDC